MTAANVKCIARANSRWSRCPCPTHKAKLIRIAKASRTYGATPRIPWEQGWTRFCELLDAGWSPTAIADATGLHPRSLLNAAEDRANGKTRKFTHGTCARLLAPLKQPTRGTLAATPSIRRLQALARLGWRLQDITDATGVPMSTLSFIQRGRATSIQARQANAITAAYRTLQNQQGPSDLTRDRATRLAWPSPMAWDNPDDLTEHPKGLGGPKHAATEHILTEVNHLADQGLDFDAIAEALDRQPTSLQRFLQRHQQDQLLARLRRAA